jgi:hypothetical protein
MALIRCPSVRRGSRDRHSRPHFGGARSTRSGQRSHRRRCTGPLAARPRSGTRLRAVSARNGSPAGHRRSIGMGRPTRSRDPRCGSRRIPARHALGVCVRSRGRPCSSLGSTFLVGVPAVVVRLTARTPCGFGLRRFPVPADGAFSGAWDEAVARLVGHHPAVVAGEALHEVVLAAEASGLDAVHVGLPAHDSRHHLRNGCRERRTPLARVTRIPAAAASRVVVLLGGVPAVGAHCRIRTHRLRHL